MHRAYIRELLLPRALPQVADHVGLDVGRDHVPLRHGTREANREVARTRTDVRDGHRRCQRERGDHRVRLLPCIARRIVEHLRPLVRILEPVDHRLWMVMRRTLRHRLRGRLRRCAAAEKHQERTNRELHRKLPRPRVYRSVVDPGTELRIARTLLLWAGSIW